MDPQQYKSLISAIIEKQATILGPDIAVIKARNVTGIDIDDKGHVVGINGDPQKVLEALIDAYVELSGQIVKSTLSPLFQKYPELRGGESM